jgi:amino acid adenylation domain-containing protein
LTATRLEVGANTAKFDLTLFPVEHAGTLSVKLEYNTDLFEQQTIARMLGHYQVLLHGIVENPEQRLSELPLLTDAEQRQLLVEWNATGRDYPRDQCVHELFVAQVGKTPDAVAVVFEGQQLTYRELNGRANQLAHYLQRLGVGPDVLVALCLDRSVEMVVGLLAILKAGAAYVPLDPSYPQERLAFMLADTQAPVLLTQQRLVDVLPQHTAQLFCLDRDWAIVSHESAENLPVQTTVDNLAYVIYTSGSTGQPKGVAVPHRAINRLVINTDYITLTSEEVVAQAANVSFDAATFEIWGALLNGARLVILPKETLLSPQQLSQAIAKQGITVMFLTTALFNEMVRRVPAALQRLQHLLFGGEAVDAQRVRELLESGTPRNLLHVYGPTETTTFASWYQVTHVEKGAKTVAIGRPIANTEVYILDGQRQPVPIGVVGELHIGGDGLARGYLHHPELTAEKFIPHPFSTEPGARLYKTGDLVRYLPDGAIEFVERVDTQVKLRGYRIELGEIEAVLRRHPAVREAVVLVREDQPGDKRLAAYVLAGEAGAPSPQTLRTYLRQKLPEYMIPSAFVSLDTWPLTPSGKVDRRTLPPPEQIEPEAPLEGEAPRTPLEELLAGIWADVLKVDKVSIYDNFFDLGGHSLLAIQVVWALERHLGRTVPVASLFHAPTIAHLARFLSTNSPAPNDGLEARLTKLWEAEFGTSPLCSASNFFELGGDWLRALRLLRRVEKETGKRLSLVSLFEAPTIGQMVLKLRQKDEHLQASFILPFRTTGSQPPFFGVGVPRQLMHYLEPDRPMYSFSPYGFDGRGGQRQSRR